MDVMYHAPSDENLKYCKITKEMVLGKDQLGTHKKAV